MALNTPGYSHLIEQYQLAVRPLQISARIDSKVKGREQQVSGNHEYLVFEPKYQPENTLAGHLQFALRYEGINLEVLSLLFQQIATDELSRSWYSPEENSTNKSNFDPVILATVIAFGFVFIHPFMDGNGRIHRYLIHEVLTNSGFTPKGIILPVSAVILVNLEEYVAALEDFSKPVRVRTNYNPEIPNAPATGNDRVYFQYFDATRQAEFLYRSLVRTIEEDLEREINYLLGFDRARTSLNSMLDWPGHSLDLFINVVKQNNGSLSKTKRDSHFDWMTDEEIKQAERAVVDAFSFES